mgnify:FL=1
MKELQQQINQLNEVIRHCPQGPHKRDLIRQIKKLRRKLRKEKEETKK